MPTASERRRQMGAKRGVVMGGQGKGASLEGFLREGPPNGDVLKGLEEMRISVLMDGVGSDGDGMVSLKCSTGHWIGSSLRSIWRHWG